MPAITAAELTQRLTAGCPTCHRHRLRAHAFVPGTVTYLEGEAVSTVTWTYQPEEFPGRVHAIDCQDCKQALFGRDECPACTARGGLAKARTSGHGVPVLGACPSCAHPELLYKVEARMHVEYAHGRLARRVLDARPGDPDFHLIEASCRSCEQTVASLAQTCAVCGRSSLLRTLR